MVSVTPVLFAAHKQCQGAEFLTSYFPVLQGAIETLPMADSGFPKREDVNPEFGAKTYYSARFLPKTA